nr:MAG TPA: hypothetical protein [Caudoviricetes sp.]
MLIVLPPLLLVFVTVSLFSCLCTDTNILEVFPLWSIDFLSYPPRLLVSCLLVVSMCTTGYTSMIHQYSFRGFIP